MRKKKVRAIAGAANSHNSKKQGWYPNFSIEDEVPTAPNADIHHVPEEGCRLASLKVIPKFRIDSTFLINETDGRGVDVRTRTFFEGNYTRVVEPGCKLSELDEFIFGYFWDPGNVANLDGLFHEASRSPFLGEEKNRLLEARTIAERLFYGEDRKDKIKYETYANHRVCVNEVYRFCCAKLETGKSRPLDFGGLDVLEFVPLIAKHFRAANFEHQELLGLPPSVAFVEFYAKMCWVQWCLVCLSANSTFERPSNANSSEILTGQKNNKGANPNYPGCCITTMYDLSNGFFFGSPTCSMIPKTDYVEKYGPSMSEISAYGYKKKMLTVGMMQRTRAYRRLAETGDLQKVYKVYFEELTKFDPKK